ncbi:hypothetical protein, partial [Streptomyces sp. NPDC056165]|uniref:hypothetical protein n=1 Tax=Streptomyces sp. NPDC056165 TaxID=3345733 RepID=UPI0035D7F905
MSGPQHTDVKLSLEILDWKDPAQVAGYVGGKCHATSANGVTKTFKGPKEACGTYRADPPEEFLVGGRLDAYAGEGRKLITVTVHGVDGTLKQDREHALQLLAEARGAAFGDRDVQSSLPAGRGDLRAARTKPGRPHLSASRTPVASPPYEMRRPRSPGALGSQDSRVCGCAWRQRANFSMAAGVTGVKKLTRLPS